MIISQKYALTREKLPLNMNEFVKKYMVKTVDAPKKLGLNTISGEQICSLQAVCCLDSFLYTVFEVVTSHFLLMPIRQVHTRLCGEQRFSCFTNAPTRIILVKTSSI